jgi:tetratricopeptide (TPR) repeat protein
MIRLMSLRFWLPAVLALSLSACTLFKSPAPQPASVPPRPPAPAPGPGETPYTPPARTFHLGAATSALVGQAHKQANGGDYDQASATLERALRIEPGNPLVWIELGRMRLGEKDAGQADALGRKALSLATGDPNAQAASWRLIADSLRARGRNQEAVDADHRAQGLTIH